MSKKFDQQRIQPNSVTEVSHHVSIWAALERLRIDRIEHELKKRLELNPIPGDNFAAFQLSKNWKIQYFSPEIIDMLGEIYTRKHKKEWWENIKKILLDDSDVSEFTLFILYSAPHNTNDIKITDIYIKKKDDPPEWSNLA